MWVIHPRKLLQEDVLTTKVEAVVQILLKWKPLEKFLQRSSNTEEMWAHLYSFA